MKCPLCKKSNSTKIEGLVSKDIISAYKKQFSIDPSNLFFTESVDFLECANCKLRFFYPLVTGDEAFYTLLPESTGGYYLQEKPEYHYAAKFVKHDDSVLEIGSGPAEFKKFILTNNYTGLEFSSKAINQAKEKEIVICKETIEEHSILNKEKYDVVCSFQVLEHVENVREFLDSAIKCLKKNGLLIITVPSEDSYLRYQINSLLNMPPHHVTRWQDATLIKISELLKLEVIELHHEQLNKIHINNYLNSLIIYSLNKTIGIKSKILDLSLKYLFVKFVAKQIRKILKFGINEHFNGVGHSVTIVLRK